MSEKVQKYRIFINTSDGNGSMFTVDRGKGTPRRHVDHLYIDYLPCDLKPFTVTSGKKERVACLTVRGVLVPVYYRENDGERLKVNRNALCIRPKATGCCSICGSKPKLKNAAQVGTGKRNAKLLKGDV